MKTIYTEPVILYRFKCPHCERIWAFGSDSNHKDKNLDDLMENGYTVCSCRCGKNFEVEVIKNEHENK